MNDFTWTPDQDFLCHGCRKSRRGIGMVLQIPRLVVLTPICRACAKRMARSTKFQRRVVTDATNATYRGIAICTADVLGIEPERFIAAIVALDGDEAAIEAQFKLQPGAIAEGVAHLKGATR